MVISVDAGEALILLLIFLLTFVLSADKCKYNVLIIELAYIHYI